MQENNCDVLVAVTEDLALQASMVVEERIHYAQTLQNRNPKRIGENDGNHL